MKTSKTIFALDTPKGSINIKENVKYSWCKQRGFFKMEDDDIFAWYPGSYQTGTPSYFGIKNILNISDYQNSFPIPC